MTENSYNWPIELGQQTERGLRYIWSRLTLRTVELVAPLFCG